MEDRTCFVSDKDDVADLKTVSDGEVSPAIIKHPTSQFDFPGYVEGGVRFELRSSRLQVLDIIREEVWRNRLHKQT